ncbi:alpha/beta hydrolase [Candidatus Woesearchaeota archaeon]|nr:alpha/beta hydrolase [Candidatus Woesearchaeota archaeon]
MANFIFIHSTGGNPDECFYPWLRKELEKRGHKAYAPFFPTPLGQTLDNWLREFEPYWQYVNEESVFVGRSIGPAFILRLLEKSKAKVKAAFLVAGFCSDLGIHEFRPLIKTFVDKPFKWSRIKANCKKFLVYNADNDLIVSMQKGEELAKNLGTDAIIVENAGHFHFKKFPKMLNDIESVIAKP